MFGWQDLLPLELAWAGVVVAAAALVVTAAIGLRRFRWPTTDEALARLDASLPGRPLAAMADTQAIGLRDPASAAVWMAHKARMAARTLGVRAVEPDLRVSARDPYGLRYLALLFFITALLFGSFWRLGEPPVAPGGVQVAAAGPAWEGWIQPPAYTGKPSLYLADQPPGRLAVPVGSTITLRLYGDVGALTVAETVSGRTGEVGSASDPQQTFNVTQAGTLSIDGAEGAKWNVVTVPDQPPSVTVTGPVSADAKGQMTLPFSAKDDYGVRAGSATIALDLSAVDRRYGLATEPDPRPALVLDLPMPISGDRAAFDEALIENLSEDPLANLPVTVTLQVTDAAGQTGSAAPQKMVLPGRRFFQPIARAVIEQRRDLLWAKANAPQVAELLRAVMNRPDGFFPNETTYLRLKVTIADLEKYTAAGLTDANQTEIAKSLWDLAVQLEDGTLADARARLQRAQDRLAEAMKNGASDAEIAALMQELRDAIDAYTNMLAQNAQPGQDQTDQPQSAQNDATQITRDQLQAMMDRIQELMQEGKMAEAQQLMDQLNQLMENLQVTLGNGQGNGPPTPGQQSMQNLQQTLRDQQGLSDRAFRDLQDQFNGGQQGQQQPGQPGQRPGQQQGQQQGQQPGQGGQQGQAPGIGANPQDGQQQGNGAGGESLGQSLADRQQALRQELQRQQQALPGMTGDQADAARRALDQAGRAMDGAEQALRDGNLADAIDKQAQAMNALREGLRNLGQALAQNGGDQPQGQGAQPGQATGKIEPSRRDPLGRQLGDSGQYGTSENMLQGPDIYRQAQNLLDEIRRRAAEQNRPDAELNYLKRLLQQF